MQRYGNTVLSGLRQYCKVLMRNCNISSIGYCVIAVIRLCDPAALPSWMIAAYLIGRCEP